MITFELPFALPLWNELRGMEAWKYRKHREAMAWQIHTAIHWTLRPAKPFQKAHIHVERYSSGTPDSDGLSVKSLLDVLQPARVAFPNGLGIIAGDGPRYLTHEIVPMRVKHTSLQKTIVTIEDRSPVDTSCQEIAAMRT